jgi:hypothetical protein
MAGTYESIRRERIGSVLTALELVTFMSRDHVEALDAMKEKRAPRFEGR